MPSLVKKELFYLKWILTAQITSTCNLNQYKVSPYAFSSNEIIERVCGECQKLMLVAALFLSLARQLFSYIIFDGICRY